MSSNIKACIMAGGLGTRLRTVVPDRPKPMADIKGHPFIEYLILYLKSYGIGNFIISIGYMSDMVEKYFGNGGKWGISIEYAREKAPLGTGGALMNALGLLSDPAIVCNGDTLIEADIKGLVRYHEEMNSAFTLVVKKAETDTFDPAGKIITDSNNKIVSIKKGMKKKGDWINGGLYCVSPSCIVGIKLKPPFSLERDAFPLLVRDRNLYIFPSDGYFCDMGTPEAYEKLQREGMPASIIHGEDDLQRFLRR